MQKPATYTLTDEQIWELVENAVANRDAMTVRALIEMLAD